MRLKYRCGRTGREVVTSIETDAITLDQMKGLKLSFWCPHCSTSHQVKAIEAYLN